MSYFLYILESQAMNAANSEMSLAVWDKGEALKDYGRAEPVPAD